MKQGFVKLIRYRNSEFNKRKLQKYRSQIKIAKGKKSFEINKAENNYRSNMKKIWFSKNLIKKGSVIKKSDLIMKRPSTSDIYPVFAEDLIGKKVLRNISVESPIKKSDLKNYVTAIIVVRSCSKRLPKKALKKICDLYTIEHLINRVKKAKKVNEIILCTTKLKQDKIFRKIAKKWEINFFAGENKNVLKRMLGAISGKKTNVVIRITGDDILIDPYFLDKTIDLHLNKNLNYSENRLLPRGTEVEIFDASLLKKIQYLAEDTSGSEYLTFYLNRYKDQFNTQPLPVINKFNKKIRLTIDTLQDFNIVRKFLISMEKKRKLINYNMSDIMNFYSKNKKIFDKRKVHIKKVKKINTNFLWRRILNQKI